MDKPAVDSFTSKVKHQGRAVTMLTQAVDFTEMLLDDDDNNLQGATIYITPPDDGDDTDQDSGDDDDNPDVLTGLSHFSGRMLQAEAEVVFAGPSNPESLPLNDAKKLSTKAKPKPTYLWRSGDLPPNNKLEQFYNRDVPLNEFLDFDRVWSPTEAAELFIFSDDVLSMIRSFTNKYAKRKGDFGFDVSVDELKVFFSVMLLSGYVKCRSRRMYWEAAADTHNEAVSNAITRNRFDEIMKYIYVYDPDTAEPGDKCAKVRPLSTILQHKFMKYRPPGKTGDIDEAMIAYYGGYGNSIKQSIRNKPVRFGYKTWCLNLDDGYLPNFDIYQGARGQQQDYKADFGVGGAVVLGLMDSLPQGIPFHLLVDNYFTSPQLFNELSDRNILVTGTFRRDRVGKCPLPSLAKKPRGEYKAYRLLGDTHDLVLVRWKDNGEMTIGSNCIGVHPVGKVTRWSAAEKKKVEVDAPAAVALYNKGMGGTDLMDHALSCNRPAIRSKKWWFPLLVFHLQASVHNSYLIYRRTSTREGTSFLEFLRPVVQTYLSSFGKSSKIPRGQMLYGRKRVDQRVDDTVRNDQTSHFSEPAMKRGRCAFCRQPSAVHRCVKCNVHVHQKCFTSYHNH